MSEVSKYSYQGPIFKYGRIVKLLLEPIVTEATSVDGAFESFVLRLSKQFGNGTSINKEAIHKVWEVRPTPVQFKTVEEVTTFFGGDRVDNPTPETTEAVSEAVESVEEVSVTPKRRKKSTATEETTNE